MRVVRLISLDTEIAMKLAKVENASELIRTLLDKHFIKMKKIKKFVPRKRTEQEIKFERAFMKYKLTKEDREIAKTKKLLNLDYFREYIWPKMNTFKQ